MRARGSQSVPPEWLTECFKVSDGSVASRAHRIDPQQQLIRAREPLGDPFYARAPPEQPNCGQWLLLSHGQLLPNGDRCLHRLGHDARSGAHHGIRAGVYDGTTSGPGRCVRGGELLQERRWGGPDGCASIAQPSRDTRLLGLATESRDRSHAQISNHKYYILQIFILNTITFAVMNMRLLSTMVVARGEPQPSPWSHRRLLTIITSRSCASSSSSPLPQSSGRRVVGLKSTSSTLFIQGRR